MHLEINLLIETTISMIERSVKAMNVIIYVNGKRVTKDDLKKIEIHNERIKRIFAEHLSHSSDNQDVSNITKTENENQI